MLIIRVMGGLGNQMQQYALYRKLKKMGKDVRLDISWFTNQAVQEQMAAPRKLELKSFEGLLTETATKEEIISVLGRRFEDPVTPINKVKYKLFHTLNPVFTETGMYHPEIFSFDDKYLVGYFACEKYYADVLALLRKDIVFPAGGDVRNADMMAQMKQTESVSVHIRRGDYLEEANKALFGNICTEAYYESAIAYMKKLRPDAEFYFFSDDPAYVKAKYAGERHYFVDWNRGENSFYDMQLMSCCKHNICANSTFSFWGARLNGYAGKLMIRPSIHKNTQVCEPQVMADLWKGWVLITPDGRQVEGLDAKH